MANRNHYIYYYSMARNSDYYYFSKCYFRLFQRKTGRKKNVQQWKENRMRIRIGCDFGILVFELHQPRQQKLKLFVTFQSHCTLGIGQSNSHFLNEHFTIVEHLSISFIPNFCGQVRASGCT